MKSPISSWQLLTAVALALAGLNSQAQVIQFSTKPFEENPPLAIPKAPSNDGASPAISFAQAKPASRSWLVKPEDLTLANVFTRWAKDAGYRVLWDARKNVMVDGTDSLSGSFEDAVTAVLQGPAVALGAYPLEVCFYANTPPLARITRKGDQDKECN